MLAIPCPPLSVFLLLSVAVEPSTIVAVSSDSSKPTTARAREYGNIIVSILKFSGMSGSKKQVMFVK